MSKNKPEVYAKGKANGIKQERERLVAALLEHASCDHKITELDKNCPHVNMYNFIRLFEEQ